MSNSLVIKRRLRSVGNIKQITKAMELVSAAKMHKASQAVVGARPYATRISALIDRLQQQNLEFHHPLLDIRPIKNELLIIITTDGGLAGGINAQVIKKALTQIKEAGHDTDLVVIGKKGNSLLAKYKFPIAATFIDVPANVPFEFCRPISLFATTNFLAKKYDLVNVVYSHFQSTLVQVPTVTQLLPLFVHPESARETANKDQQIADAEAMFEPSVSELLKGLLPKLVDQLFFEMMLESAASEHSARMIAMRSATDNAEDLSNDLQLTFNSERQTAITAEMAEISSSITALEQ